MMTDFDELIGRSGAPAGRPAQAETIARRENAAQTLEALTRARRRETDEFPKADSIETLHITDVQHGVSVGTLAQIFGMDPTTVRKKLVDCAPIARRKAGHVYDMKMAAQFLVKPVFDVTKYLASVGVKDLPVHLQAAYWAAMTDKQKWEKEAGQLWRTEDVMAVFGDVFQTIKFAMQLWPDTVERATGLSVEQRSMLTIMADALQNEIHRKLLDLPTKKKTKSTLSEAPVIELEASDGSEFI